MSFVLFPHGKWTVIKQVLLQWVMVVCAGVAGWERVKLAWFPHRTPLHCHLGEGAEPQGKVWVCQEVVWYNTSLSAAGVRQDLLDHVKRFSVRHPLWPVLQRVVAGLMHVLISLWNNLLKQPPAGSTTRCWGGDLGVFLLLWVLWQNY